MADPAPGPEATLSAVHKEVGAVMGQLTIALARRRLRPGDPAEWASALREAARRLDDLAGQRRG